MTGAELRDAVAALGFTSELPDDEGFIQSANLAMLRLRTLIPTGDESPKPISYDTLNEQLPIAPELSEAAVLLVAYYVWLEDDAQKAAAYRAEYDYAVAQIMRRRKVEHTEITTNNW